MHASPNKCKFDQAESAAVIKEAIELGILNTLDISTANELKNRVANLTHSGEIQKQ